MKACMKLIMCFLVLTCMLALTACKDSDEQKSTTQTPEKNSEVEPDSSADSAEKKNEKPSSDPSKDSGSSSTDSKPKPNPPNSSIDPKISNQIKNILEQAKQGKVPNVAFAAHTSDIEDVEKVWGKADKTEPAGKGMYSTYKSKKVVIGFNKGSQIFDVRSNHSDLHTITLQDIEKVLGKPMSVKVNGNDKIYIYKVNDQFELKFVIPSSTGKVDHISVFSPGDSINNMAG
ncbi:YjgB family protein [Bacillus sp. Xin]|uniref:YjgB family protein n=1 Tax=unclassified Bacillus (in: firmicutes) TaxID=185979 RepID=UPI00157253B7|nr:MULTISPECIES: YjgB family protein [unclassified Bacillus (in: firmicutes)]MBC6973084.1 YjgB family protein [Bacillus sp. Xin]NSW36274.1 YjgB family protein [Bacillus sp. Xin1]